VDFVFFDVEVVDGLNDKNVFIPFFPALGRFIKHRVSDHLQTTLFIRLIVFISEAVFFSSCSKELQSCLRSLS